ncbi:MAG: hypothetical protein H6818_05665 [Phycisphaerales bacterium]|nr:hypothetical protein [Phycisphaerales bacterium]MCB9862750.1 hypothetical protein [Phycisphaerales bacterium]
MTCLFRCLNRLSLFCFTTLVGLLVVGCSQPHLTVERKGEIAPLYRGMGPHTRKVTTTSPIAQRYFNQGLNWAYAFNHDEAIRSFEQAAAYDPNCAMAYWGIALCNGPHINNPIMTPDRSEAAWVALQKAVILKSTVSPIERDLISALETRYANPAPADRSSLDAAYANAMAAVWQKYPSDDDAGALYAESMMDLHPWDLWTQDGRAKQDTESIIALLEAVLKIEPNHPGANHLYIHAVEGARPAKAVASADRLRNLMPASGHMLHMPSHIYVLTGRWREAAKQNERAIVIDADYRAISPNQGFYRLYMLHNHHMLSFASMMSGRDALALKTAREVVESMPEDYKRANAAFVDPYMGAAYDALKRFGRWDEMIAEPPPGEYLPITTAMYHFNRAVAYAAKGDVANAEKERAIFRANRQAVPADAMMAINKAHDILTIADHFLDGEIEFRKGDIDASVAELRTAAALEDKLIYMEPPEWVQPVRHTLGAVLLSEGRHDEAAVAYQADLKKWPENGWSLYGMRRCMEMAGNTKEAAAYDKRFHAVWAGADMPIASSCLCIPKT